MSPSQSEGPWFFGASVGDPVTVQCKCALLEQFMLLPESKRKKLPPCMRLKGIGSVTNKDIPLKEVGVADDAIVWFSQISS